ncbi:hypothetical protein [Nonlabens sp.]|uniref:hypothetical protein n=1 Tax=Nonlabens sp. TaxID=1888209 RepID=UPI003F69A990
MILIKTSLLKNYKGMMLWPFLLVKDRKYGKDVVFMNHEKIHAQQQKELLIVIFYLWYVSDYLIQLLKYKNHHKAYRNIVFERESYFYECSLDYLITRNFFSFLKFYNKKYSDG